MSAKMPLQTYIVPFELNNLGQCPCHTQYSIAAGPQRAINNYLIILISTPVVSTLMETYSVSASALLF